MFQHSMRAYFLPLIAGFALMASAFMPWIMMGDVRAGGVPDVGGLWVLALGCVAVILAALSFYTRKNSRHPLLLVGLAAFAILIVTEKLMERSMMEQAWARAQALSIVEGGVPADVPEPLMALGAYLGLAAAATIALFGLTIVVRRVATPFVVSEDDDV